MPTYNNLPAPSEHFKGKWYQKLIEDLQLAGKAKRTVYGYVRAVRKLADFCQQAPHLLTENDVRQFLLIEMVKKQIASGTQSTAKRWQDVARRRRTARSRARASPG